MKFTPIDFVLLAGLIIVCYIFISRMKFVTKNLQDLLNIVGALKYRVFDHEAQLLNKKGVYVPEDSAEFVFKIAWSMLSEDIQEALKKDYEDNCPKHIPLWKYILYNYKVNTVVKRKEPYGKIDSTADLIADDLDEIKDLAMRINDLSNSIKELESKSKEHVEEISNQIHNLNDLIDTIDTGEIQQADQANTTEA